MKREKYSESICDLCGKIYLTIYRDEPEAKNYGLMMDRETYEIKNHDRKNRKKHLQIMMK